MLERAQTRALPLVTRAGEHAPMVTACCNACRVCVQTNAVGLVLAGAAGAGAAVVGFLRRLRARRAAPGEPA